MRRQTFFWFLSPKGRSYYLGFAHMSFIPREGDWIVAFGIKGKVSEILYSVSDNKEDPQRIDVSLKA